MADPEHLTELYHVHSTDQWDADCICGWKSPLCNSADSAHDYAVDHRIDALTAENAALATQLEAAHQPHSPDPVDPQCWCYLHQTDVLEGFAAGTCRATLPLPPGPGDATCVLPYGHLSDHVDVSGTIEWAQYNQVRRLSGDGVQS